MSSQEGAVGPKRQKKSSWAEDLHRVAQVRYPGGKSSMARGMASKPRLVSSEK